MFTDSFFFKGNAAPRDLPPFPTRRSSDLVRRTPRASRDARAPTIPAPRSPAARRRARTGARRARSEEHTSELQSPCNLVCRLLLVKKNQLRQLTILIGGVHTACAPCLVTW